MKNFISIIGICILAFGMNACKMKGSNNAETTAAVLGTGETPENSLDWSGTYTGTVPCADCDGIFTQIVLNMDKTYSLKTTYLGKDGIGENTKGTFQWDAAGRIITLSGLKEKSMPSTYKVVENKLIQLDMDGNVITGTLESNYVLLKVMDWNGTYTGTVPCADCEGIFTQIALNPDKTYSLKTTYLGKKGIGDNIEGTYQWDAAKKIITLSGLKEKSMPSSYKFAENKLIQLDMNGNVITGALESNYVLIKVNENLVEKKWKLFELNGITLPSKKPNPATEAFIMFQIDGNKVNGNSGCNNFTGTYKTDSDNSLHFSGMVTTRKMCVDMSIEKQMNQLFQTVDNYSITDDTLSLNQAEKSLARFVLAK